MTVVPSVAAVAVGMAVVAVCMAVVAVGMAAVAVGNQSAISVYKCKVTTLIIKPYANYCYLSLVM